MWNIDLIQIQQYYETQVMLRYIQERKGKRRKKVNMADVLSI
jgi:hypothetical protein